MAPYAKTTEETDNTDIYYHHARIRELFPSTKPVSKHSIEEKRLIILLFLFDREHTYIILHACNENERSARQRPHNNICHFHSADKD